MSKLTVIIPNYNDIRIERSLKSLSNQTYNDFELIVVDGDSSNEEVFEIYKKYRIDKLIVEKDEGLFDALNKGIKASTGDYIYLMGSDDYLSSVNVFSKVMNIIGTNEYIDGVCLGCSFVNSKGKVIRKWFPKKISSDRIKKGLYPPHFSLFLNKKLYDLVGLFKYQDTSNIACDSIWLLDLAILKNNLNIRILSDEYLNMEYGGTSTGSIKNIIRQFLIMNSYAINKKIKGRYFHSIIKSVSKIFQFFFRE